MHSSRKEKEAIDYIQRTTKKQFKQSELVNKGKIVVDKHTKEEYRHEAVANDILKIINVTPGLSRLCKSVVSMRIINPGISDFKIALQHGILEQDVPLYIAHAKEMSGAFMRSSQVQEARNRFNADRIIASELKNLNKTESNPLMAD